METPSFPKTESSAASTTERREVDLDDAVVVASVPCEEGVAPPGVPGAAAAPPRVVLGPPGAVGQHGVRPPQRPEAGAVAAGAVRVRLEGRSAVGGPDLGGRGRGTEAEDGVEVPVAGRGGGRGGGHFFWCVGWRWWWRRCFW